ncbi:LOW QUALITY PROTEIN: putative leucine-rich repeat-containing protein DDB_G0290503 [Argopecten irradians]|uniref:LOW QUALITY PROTEIN: putative leucine-rich repeat-containing protein DDB_G0290503 n=1 Tax=Argopecten irradians TaxID=31199 RepID=UPI0037186C29
MDLSWSQEHKADATTILKDLQLEVKKNINELNTNLHKLDNVSVALNEGKTAFDQVLCESCKNAVDSKYKELHSEESSLQKKPKYKRLPPERQEIVNEITKVFMQIEHPQTDNQSEGEYCTQEEYHAQQILELENSFKKQLLEKQTELFDLKQRLKKVESERDENIKKAKSMPGNAVSNAKYEREIRRYQSENKRLQSDLDSSERRNKELRRDIDRSEDDVKKHRELLDEERTRREAAESADVRVRHADSYTSSAPTGVYENENEGDLRNRRQVPTTERQTGHGKSGPINRTQSDNVSAAPDTNGGIGSEEVSADSTPEETIARLKKIERGASIVQKENDEFRGVITQLKREKKELQDKNDQLQRTNEEVTSAMKDLQRDNDKLTRELDNNNSELSRMRNGDRYDRDDNDKYDREISRLKRERQSLRGEMDSLRRAHDDTKSSLRDLQRDHDGLTEELGAKEREIHELKRALENSQYIERRSLDTFSAPGGRYDNGEEGDIMERRQTQTTERHTGQEKSGLINKTKKDGDSAVPVKEKETGVGAIHSGDTTDRLNMDQGDAILQKDSTSIKREITQLHTERKTLQDKNDHLHRTNEEMKSVMRDLQRDNDRLMRELDDHSSDLSKMRKGERYERNHNESYEREISRLKRERQSHREEIKSLRRYHDDTSSNLRDLKKDHEGLTDELGVKEQETHKLKKASVDTPRLGRRPIAMKVRRGNRSGIDKPMTDVVFKELKRMLGGIFDLENIDFSIVLTSTTNVTKGLSFVISLNTYVQAAIQGIKGNADTYIIALHYIDEENISLITPTREHLTGDAVQHLGGILDIVFNNDNELYECDINNSAIDQIVTLLKQH